MNKLNKLRKVIIVYKFYNEIFVESRKTNKPYFNISQIKNLISKDKIYQKDKTLEELNFARNWDLLRLLIFSNIFE